MAAYIVASQDIVHAPAHAAAACCSATAAPAQCTPATGPGRGGGGGGGFFARAYSADLFRLAAMSNV
jgi:hypothetical protein